MNNNTWTFTIEGMDDTELEKWATNGEAWTYIVTEAIDETTDKLQGTSYIPENGIYTWQADADDNPLDNGCINLGEVTNTILTLRSVPKGLAG